MAESRPTHTALHNNLNLRVNGDMRRFKTGDPLCLDPVIGGRLEAKGMVKPISEDTAEVVDGGDGGGINASTPARALAEANGIDLTTVTGTGKEGAIGKPDVQAVIDAAASSD